MITVSASVELLYTVSQQLNSSLDLDEVLGRVLRLTVEATGAGRGSLFLLDEEGHVVRQILARPNQPPEVSRSNVDKVMTKGLAGWVYHHRQPALVTDTTKDSRWVRLPNDQAIMGAALVIPLMHKEQVNGVLALHHKQVSYFTEEHLSLAMSIAGQAATAVENARLYTQAKSEHAALYALMSGMPIPVLVINKGQIVFHNRTAAQSLPVKENNIPLTQIAGGQALQQALSQLRKNDDTHIEVQWPDKRVFNVSINEVPQHGTVVALHDISYLKELDNMKSLFVETVSHDLKSPLSAIHGYATILSLSKNLSERDQLNLNNILQTTRQMQSLIENLLNLAEIEAGLGGQHMEACDIVEIAQDVIDQYQLKIEEKELSLSVQFPDTLPKVMGDPLRLSQVVANYVSNAVKYTPYGGHIVVRGQRRETEITLEVSDNGPGIPPAAQSQLFQKFYRVPPDNGAEQIEGTGLGLSIVKAIVEGYGGHVWVKSETGVGSTFGCALPVSAVDY